MYVDLYIVYQIIYSWTPSRYQLTRGDTAGAITLPMPENGPIIVQPNKTALVIIDMQNFFLHESLNGDPKGRAIVRKYKLCIFGN